MLFYDVKLLLFTSVLVCFAGALRHEASQSAWNLNQNQSATDPLEYWGEWQNHIYTESPTNWRMPFYTLSLDRYANGDPANDDANHTRFEHDWMSNQFRFGGDARGLMNDLDYIHGMGIKVIYLIGSPFINQPWTADGYSPLDFTLLDYHHGSIDDWRQLITAIHDRGMYVVLDNTMSTMGDLLGFSGHANSTAPFSWDEYDYFWKSDRRYHDFTPGTAVNESCQYPRFWDGDGNLLTSILDEETQCRDSEFSLYGDLQSIGNYPVYMTQLGKFGSVQDRLREWRSDVLAKIEHFSCMQIAMLDIDGFRMDKALQTSVDAMAAFSKYQRECARRYGKENFLMIGEVVGADPQAAIYIGRGKEPGQYFANSSEAIAASNDTDFAEYIREYGSTALDGSAFHYSTYAALTRLLGLDGPIGQQGVDFVSLWNSMVVQNDFINANTGQLDPRHLFGTTSQDVFRWPALTDGTQRQLLGQFITILMMPGAPALFWGEEQSFYLLDSTADNYLYGRSPMSSNRAWQLHGCYHFTDSTYVDFPLGPARDGCHDDDVSLDHKDPSHPVRSVIKRMYELRQHYPAVNDGYHLETLSNQTRDVYRKGSDGVPSPTGIFSVYRSGLEDFQAPQGRLEESESVWLIYSNEEQEKDFTFDCQEEGFGLISPYLAGSTVKNLFYPYDEYTLENSTIPFNRAGSRGFAGCLSNLTMSAWGFKSFISIDQFTEPAPAVTRVVPSHDSRIIASVGLGQQETVPIEVHFSTMMSCDSVASNLLINSTTGDGSLARVKTGTVSCDSIEPEEPEYVGQPVATWKFSAELENVSHGIHTFTVRNASSEGGIYTDAVDRFMFRIGRSDNPIVYPQTANYTTDLLHRDESTDALFISPNAPGADKLRYSQTWGSSYSPWIDYTGDRIVLQSQSWYGTDEQHWNGEHVIVQYWSEMAGSSEHVQHGDLDFSETRRWPHAFVLGSWNTWGYDDGLSSAMSLRANGLWTFDLGVEFPTQTTINVWGMNPDSQPDKTMQYGDVDGDSVLDWLHPDTLSENLINVTSGPGMPFVGWNIQVDDGTYNFSFIPTGSAYFQIALAILLALVPPLTGSLAVWAFKRCFYQVKINQLGIEPKVGMFNNLPTVESSVARLLGGSTRGKATLSESQDRRTVLVATMEYEIEDWKIKIKIGGLGVMASLMAKALGHKNIIWVVPCVGGVDYPVDTPAEPMVITINGSQYKINVQYHTLRNITFVLLDAPVFRQQSKEDPYPVRMDDLDSAIYYSAWNACIAETIKRFPVDIYHINDYHGAIAPLYLLPRKIPVCLSLHNAEFQGLWSLRSAGEMREISRVFNLSRDIITHYVQFGEVFNLLHAGASYIRTHQKGYGAIGVSKKYGIRALKRYPIFWGLSNIGSLPNPDPADMAEWDEKLPDPRSVVVDKDAESARGQLRCQAQEWAGLEVNSTAQLFVFVGRWSEQKGVDLIADVFPDLLDRHHDVQLICIGPVIDLYGKFAAIKLQKMMERYPGRVCSKPEFTALPPFIFSGAEFALIPSRDEPFGLVAVEFGRKGALGVGSRVGGLGQMPGWWFTIESTATKHLLHQFKSAIEAALGSSQETRALMRARSSQQRFPVAQWVRDLEKLQNTSIYLHHSVARGSVVSLPTSPIATGYSTPIPTAPSTIPSSAAASRAHSPVRRSILPTMTSGSESGMSTPSSPATGRFAARHSLMNALTPRLNALAELRSSGPEADISENPDHATPERSLPLDSRVDSQAVPETSLPHPLSTALASNNQSVLTVDTVVGGRSDFKMQNVDPFFNDTTGRYYTSFQNKLDSYHGSLSAEKLCVEEYLKRSEKDWFSDFYDAKLGKTNNNSSADSDREFQLGQDYVPPTGVRGMLQRKIGDWPIYAFLLAFGQIIAANSYQIVLLTGQNGQSANTLYAISSIFLGTTIIWWLLFRRIRSFYVLSLPFLFYGVSFFLLGITPYVSSSTGITWMQNTATGLYAFASASGFLFFTLNFYSEGGTPVRTWVFRACAIQGTQQLYLAALWYWGSYVSSQRNSGSGSTLTTSTPVVTAITVPIAVLMWVVGVLLFFGLPNAYRTKPGTVPALYASILRRKVVVWFFVVVIIQNYWLSASYGRSWTYLWSSNLAPPWTIAILALVFFVGVWIILLAGFAKLSNEHSWALPLFAIGLGAPRWAQMLWGTSGVGLYLPWVLPGNSASALVGTLVGRGLWLWLGVLDTLQSVGFGMILLQTLARVHMTCAIAGGQILGSLFTIAARASAPNKTGPGPVFPNLALNLFEGISNAWFWVPLGFQLLVCLGFFMFFRKEQLFKP